MAPEDEHLEPLGRFGVGVEPDQRAVAPPAGRMRDHGVGTRNHVQGRSLPVEPVAAGGESRAVEPAGVVPELEGVIGRVEPGAVVEGGGDRAVAAVQLQVGFGRKDRRGLVDPGCVVDAAERGVFDQEVVHEELPAHVDWDHAWRIGQIRNRQRIATWFNAAGRPLGGELDAVVERQVGRSRLRSKGALVIGRRRSGGGRWR